MTPLLCPEQKCKVAQRYFGNTVELFTSTGHFYFFTFLIRLCLSFALYRLKVKASILLLNVNAYIAACGDNETDIMQHRT